MNIKKRLFYGFLIGVGLFVFINLFLFPLIRGGGRAEYGFPFVFCEVSHFPYYLYFFNASFFIFDLIISILIGILLKLVIEKIKKKI